MQFWIKAIASALAVMTATTGSAQAAPANFFLMNNLGNVFEYAPPSNSAERLVAAGHNASTAFTFAPDGNSIFIARDDAFQEYDLNGSLLTNVVNVGPGCCNSIIDIEFGPNGNLYVLDNLSHIFEINPTNGAQISLHADGFGPLRAFTFAPNGNIFAARDNGYQQFDASGTMITNILNLNLAPLDGILDIEWGPDGLIYLMNEIGNIRGYVPGTATPGGPTIATPNNSTDFTFSPMGTIFVARDGAYREYGTDGTLLQNVIGLGLAPNDTVRDIAFAPVPLPAAWAMLGLALVSFGAAARAQKRRG